MQKEVLGSIYTDVSDDFQRGIYPIARCVKATTHDLGIVEMEVKQIGNISDCGSWDNPQAGRIYDSSGICPTINTCGGGQREVKTIVRMCGRNPDNPADRTAGIPTEQRLEPNSQGICNTLTSVQKDNLVLEKNIDGVMKMGNVNPSENGMNGSIYSSDGLSATLTTNKGEGQKILDGNKFRIRKLTPLECWRLMDFSDEDFYKAASVCSNSQLYKQAGNSIVKAVLMAIFNSMM